MITICIKVQLYNLVVQLNFIIVNSGLMILIRTFNYYSYSYYSYTFHSHNSVTWSIMWSISLWKLVLIPIFELMHSLIEQIDYIYSVSNTIHFKIIQVYLTIVPCFHFIAINHITSGYLHGRTAPCSMPPQSRLTNLRVKMK